MADGAPVRQQSRVLFASSEAYPLAKTGGLGDVAGALPAALARLGIDIRLILPGYLSALDIARDKRVLSSLPGGGRLILGRMPNTGLPIYLLDRPDLFRRSGGLYQDNERQDWPDNHMRYGAFCDAVVHIALHGDGYGWCPDLVHANDWHTALVPARLALENSHRPPTVFTIHNLAFQGSFPLTAADDLGLSPSMLTPEGAEFYGQFSFLKAGIRYSDRLTTVSPRYAREILTPEYGAGLDGVMRSRADDLIGILNGVDYAVWDPANDHELQACYSIHQMAGKGACKTAIQDELGLERSDNIPLVSFTNRLTHQKMADVLLEAVPALMKQSIQLVVHGEGDQSLEGAFLAASRDRPMEMIARIGYQESLAHRLLAGSDIVLTPARFEPCGLTTMFAMRYGSPPVARSVGGLTDTIIDFANAHPEEATGYTFAEPTVGELTACVGRACEGFRDKTAWRTIQRNGMRRDFSWDGAARQYAAIYRDLAPAGEWSILEAKSSDACLAPR
jgi:starch synthase